MHSPGPPPTISPPPSASKKSEPEPARDSLVPITSVATPPDSNSESHLSNNNSEDERDQQEKETSTDRFIALISKYSSQGTLAPADCVFTISPEDFYKAQHALRQNDLLWAFFINKVRYDYDGQTVVLRMPGKVHESILSGVAGVIDEIIRKWQQSADEVLKQLALRIDQVRSFPVEHSPSPHSKSVAKDEGRSIIKPQKNPDASYGFDGKTVFILEIAVSESEQAAVVKKEEYFDKGSGGTIQTVIYVFGKDPDDEGRPRLVTLDYYHVSAPQDAEGKHLGEFSCDHLIYSERPPDSYEKLDLSLSDFVPDDVLEQARQHNSEFVPPTVSIPLDSFYNTAKTWLYSNKAPSGQSRGKNSIVWTRKRSRTVFSEADAASDAEAERKATRFRSTHPEAEFEPYVVEDIGDDGDGEQRSKKLKTAAASNTVVTRSSSGPGRSSSSRCHSDKISSHKKPSET